MLNAVGLHVCMACKAGDLRAAEMSPLSNGDPSNTCKRCWAAWEAKREAELPELREKWSRDRAANLIEAERRERERGKKREDAYV